MNQSVKESLIGKTLSNGEVIEKVALFHNIAAYLFNDKFVVSLGAATRPEIDVTKAKSISDYPNESYS